jgi:hypothetical protein
LASRTQSSSRPASHAGLAVLFGIVGVLAIPAAVAYSRVSTTFSLLDAAYVIPLAAIASVGGLLVVRGARGHVRFSAEPSRALRIGRWLAVAGICLTLSASIAVGFYELLLRLEG